MKSHHTLCLRGLAAAVVMAAMGLAACSSASKKNAPVASTGAAAEPAASAPASVPPADEAASRPSLVDTLLADGLKSYQAGQYRQAEGQLRTALQAGLRTPTDTANANKHLAFIYCITKRYALCESAFKAAKAADPGFALTRSEAGHPMWAQTYKKALGLK